MGPLGGEELSLLRREGFLCEGRDAPSDVRGREEVTELKEHEELRVSETKMCFEGIEHDCRILP